jgi:outer membrane protein OmpA-like peptidoglycan-associated protein
MGTLLVVLISTQAPASPTAATCLGDPRLTLGAFGRLSALDTDLPVNSAIGAGGRIGACVGKDWYLEGDLSVNKDFEEGPQLTYTPIHLRLARQWHSSETTRYRFAFGYVHTIYEGGPESDIPEDDPLSFDGSDDGVSAAIGLERDFGKVAAFRIDAVLDANFRGTLAEDDTPDWHFGLEAGLTLGLGGNRRADGDEDRDHIPDSKDLCPGTPLGTTVDGDGCPILFAEGSTNVVLQGVHFEVDNDHLLPESRAALDQVAQGLLAHPIGRIEIQGHTDNTGDPVRNRELATARANVVRDYLVAKGVNPARLTAVGYGPDRPIDTNDTEAGRARNRRVELRRM